MVLKVDEMNWDQSAQSIAKPETHMAKVFGKQNLFGRCNLGAQNAGQKPAGQRRRAQPRAAIKEKIGDRAFADLVPLVEQNHLVQPRSHFGAGKIVQGATIGFDA